MDSHFDFIFVRTNQPLTIELDSCGRPWFYATQIANLLGYTRAYDMIRMLMPEERMLLIKQDNGSYINSEGTFTTHIVRSENRGAQEIYVINEPGLYRIAMSSRSDRSEVEQFKNWVFYEVLPSIRISGVYISPDVREHLKQNPEYITEMIAHNEELEKQIESMKPSVEYHQRVIDHNGSISMHEMAKLLYNNVDAELGRNRLMAMMKVDGYLLDDNMPSQVSIENRLLILVRDEKGYLSSKVTPHGESYFLGIYSNIPYEAIDAYISRREMEKVARKHQVYNMMTYINHTTQMYGPFNDPVSMIHKRQIELAGHQVSKVPLFKNLTPEEQKQREQDPLYRQLKDLGIAS